MAKLMGKERSKLKKSSSKVLYKKAKKEEKTKVGKEFLIEYGKELKKKK